jgi:hypothetical protein
MHIALPSDKHTVYVITVIMDPSPQFAGPSPFDSNCKFRRRTAGSNCQTSLRAQDATILTYRDDWMPLPTTYTDHVFEDGRILESGPLQ